MANDTDNAQNAQNAQNTQKTENMKKIFHLGAVLFIVTAITGLILGAVNDITAEPIRQTQARLRAEALAAALPEASEFTAIEPVSSGEGSIIKDVQEGTSDGKSVGYCITVAPSGYGGEIVIVVGIDESGGLRAIQILSQTETPGLGAKAPLPAFSGQFSDKSAEELVVVKIPPSAPDEIQAISGATITSNAVTLGVNSALEYWRDNLKGRQLR